MINYDNEADSSFEPQSPISIKNPASESVLEGEISPEKEPFSQSHELVVFDPKFSSAKGEGRGDSAVPAISASIHQDSAAASASPVSPFGSSGGSTFDEALLKTFLMGKSPKTQESYERVTRELLDFIHPMLLRDVGLPQLQAFLELKSKQAHESQRLRLAIVNSFFSYALKTGYIPANPASFLPKPQAHNQIAERYLTVEEVIRMISLTPPGRDQVLLKTLYSAGLRLSELLSLNFEHLQEREGGEGQLLIVGKGNKKRTVVVSAGVFSGLLSLTGYDAMPSDPVFRSTEETNPRLSKRMAQVIVDQARLRAGIVKKVSPHWLRHAHASHALDRGAPLHLVQATLGHSSIATTGKYLHARPQQSSGRFLDI